MRLNFCPSCGQAVELPIPNDIDAIREWQDEIRRECQHEPRCGGPWQHAVRIVREEWDRAARQR